MITKVEINHNEPPQKVEEEKEDNDLKYSLYNLTNFSIHKNQTSNPTYLSVLGGATQRTINKRLLGPVLNSKKNRNYSKLL